MYYNRCIYVYSLYIDLFFPLLVFPLKMKWGGKSCPAAFPPAIRVIVSLVPDLKPFLYIYKVVRSSIFNALYKDHKITQYITQTECWLDAFTLISNLYLK